MPPDASRAVSNLEETVMTAQSPTPPSVSQPGTPSPNRRAPTVVPDLADPPWTLPTPNLGYADADSMREALVSELAPTTGLQRVVAQNIAENEADLLGLRHRHNAILADGARTALDEALTPHFEAAERRDVVEGWESNSRKANAMIERLGIDPEMPLNLAWLRLAPILTSLSAQIAALERRRRHLIEDYERLQAAERGRKKGPVEEAQIVG